MDIAEVDKQILQAFQQYNWPGKVRELEHIIEGSMNLVTDGVTTIGSTLLPFHFINQSDVRMEAVESEHPTSNHYVAIAESNKNLKDLLVEVESSYIKNTLHKHKNNITRTAESLGISKQSLQYRLREFKINQSSIQN